MTNLGIHNHETQPLRATNSLKTESERPDPWLNDGFAPDFLVASQFYDLTRRRSSLDGETRLVYAVLEDAVRCYVKHSRSTSATGRALFDEVVRWFNCVHGALGPFSFIHICDVLGLDPDFLRAQLPSLRPQDLPTKQMRSVGRRHVVRTGRRNSAANRSRRALAGI